MEPSRTSRPASRMPTRSQTRSTSPRRCELRKIVFPSLRSRSSTWRTWARPTGSTPSDAPRHGGELRVEVERVQAGAVLGEAVVLGELLFDCHGGPRDLHTAFP